MGVAESPLQSFKLGLYQKPLLQSTQTNEWMTEESCHGYMFFCHVVDDMVPMIIGVNSEFVHVSQSQQNKKMVIYYVQHYIKEDVLYLERNTCKTD